MNQKRQEIRPSKIALERHIKALAEAQKIIRQIFPEPQPYQEELKNYKPEPVVYIKKFEVIDGDLK